MRTASFHREVGAKVHGEGRARMGDLGGSATTLDFTDAVIVAL